MANVLKNRVLTLCDLAEQWGSIYKFFSFCDLSNLEVNYLHSCPSLAWPERPLSPVASGPHTTPPSVASQITGLKINFHLSLCQPQYNKTIFMKRSVLIWPDHLSHKLPFADFRSFLANIISTSFIPLLLNSNWSSVEVLLYDFFTDSLQFPLRCQILCCCVQTVCRRGVQCSDSTQSCKNTRAQILHFTFSIVWLQSVMVTSLPH